MNRRDFIISGIAVAAMTRQSYAVIPPAAGLDVAVSSPWLTNGATVSSNGTIFINLPRFKGHENSPALAKVTENGPVAFPGNGWNQWQPGDSGVNRLVNVNAVHIFNDDRLWVVDQGAPEDGKPAPGAAKLIAFDITTGRTSKIIRFDEQSLPPGGAPNDLRIHGNLIFVTDSGLGGIIIHDLKTSVSKRKLSASPLLKKPSQLAQKGFAGRILSDDKGKRPEVHSDMLEVSPEGKWLYFATPTGPLYRIQIHFLLNDALDDAALEQHIEKFADIPSIGGTAMDSLGNLYLSNVENRSVDLLLPGGDRQVLIQDDRLVSADALFIDRNRNMYIPAPQLEYLPSANQGKDKTAAPFVIYKFPLPLWSGVTRLGNAQK